MYYNVIKSSVDGDRSQVFWVTQKLKNLRENTGQNSNIIHSGLTKMRNSLKEISFQKCKSQHPCRKSNATAKKCHLMRNISQML